jgi:hypothetical protein
MPALLWAICLLVVIPRVCLASMFIQNPSLAEPNGTHAIQALVERRLPSYLHGAIDFVIESGPKLMAGDEFNITQPTHGRIKISGTSTSALSRGLLVSGISIL